MADFVFSIAGSRELVAAFALLGAAALLYAALRGTLALHSRIFGGDGGSSPFLLEAADSIYGPEGAGVPPVFRREMLDVFGIGGSFLETLTLRATALEDVSLGDIRVEFARKRLGKLVRVLPEEFRVESLRDAGPAGEFSARADGAGGFEGRYSPPRALPAGGTLWLRVGYKLDVAREAGCLLVFRQLREGKGARTASMKLVFRNREPIDA